MRHFSDTEWESDLLAARRWGYAPLFSRLIPGELIREQVVLDVLRPFDLARVLHRIRSEEVRGMLNQELNYAIFLHRQSQSRAERINSLLPSIRAALSTGT